MPALKTYTRVNWAAYPTKTTQISATNLNKMDKGIDDLDDEIVTIKNTLENLSYDADDISYENTSSGLQATDVQDAVDEIDDNLTNLSNRLDNLKFKEVEFNAPSTSGNIEYHNLGTLIGETISFSHVLSVRIFNKGNNKWYSVTIISDGYVEYNIQDNSLGIKLSANGVSAYGNSTIRALIGYYSDN